MVAVSSWGRLGRWEHEVRALTDPRHVAKQLLSPSLGLAYGMGRSYGDSCLNPDGVLWQTTGMDRFIQFDAVSGLLVCEAGCCCEISSVWQFQEDGFFRSLPVRKW